MTASRVSVCHCSCASPGHFLGIGQSSRPVLLIVSSSSPQPLPVTSLLQLSFASPTVLPNPAPFVCLSLSFRKPPAIDPRVRETNKVAYEGNKPKIEALQQLTRGSTRKRREEDSAMRTKY